MANFIWNDAYMCIFNPLHVKSKGLYSVTLVKKRLATGDLY